MGGRGGAPWYPGGTTGGACPYGGIPPGMYPGIPWGGPPYWPARTHVYWLLNQKSAAKPYSFSIINI